MGVSLIELFLSSNKQLAEFKCSVERNHGTLPVLVHPLFGEEADPVYPLTEGYRTLLHQYTTSLLESGLPLLVFESRGDWRRLSNLLGQQAKGNIYGVRTYPYSPNPEGGTNEWIELVCQLRKVGARRMTIGGRYLVFNPVVSALQIGNFENHRDFARDIDFHQSKRLPLASRWLNKELVPSGCVGALGISLLKEGFDVGFSTASSPRFIMDAVQYVDEVHGKTDVNLFNCLQRTRLHPRPL
jgi:hypothetical protein